MPERVATDPGPRLVFSAPWESLAVRRGDALGLRALTDTFADIVAPDLTNRVSDARWVTILAWCLARSHDVFHARGRGSLTTRTDQSKRYAWLRPLELMWVARTIALTGGGANRSLAGQRRVGPWLEQDAMRNPRFGMTEDQFHAYRQTGTYGGYRIAFRRWPGMTISGDGWTPGKATLLLARWMDKKLGDARPPWPLLGEEGDERKLPRRSVRGDDEESEWWLGQWKNFRESGRNFDRNTLPRPRNDFTKLPEAGLIEPLLFGDHRNGQHRRKVVSAVAQAHARNHIELCEYLGQAFAGNPSFVILPRFSRLADAGMAAMELITKALQERSRVELDEVVSHPEAASRCDELRRAAEGWLQAAHPPLRHVETARCFADAFRKARTTRAVLLALVQHHENHGGGLRWFVVRNGWIEPRTPWRGGSPGYRFRLWSLCRLATQCGVLHEMPRALVRSAEQQAMEAEDE